MRATYAFVAAMAVLAATVGVARAQDLPIVTRVSPRVCCTGDSTFLITGRNFTPSSTVRIGTLTVQTTGKARMVTASGGTVLVVASDTLLIVRVPTEAPGIIWPVGSGGMSSGTADGVYLEVKTAAGTAVSARKLHRLPIIRGMWPNQGAATTDIHVNASGWTAGTVFFEAPDGNLLPASGNVTVGTTDLFVRPPSGFRRSPIHIRRGTDDGLVIESVSPDTFTITGSVPIITSINPRVCCTADSVLFIVGSNFTSSSTVRVGLTTLPTLRTAQFVTPQGTSVSVSASDTLLLVRIQASIWAPTLARVQPGLDADGGAHVEVTAAAGSGYSAKHLYRPPTITSIFPQQGPAGAAMVVKGTRLLTGGAAWVEAPDGTLLPMIRNPASGRTDVEVQFQLPAGGFRKSPIHLRTVLKDGLVIDAMSADTFRVTGSAPLVMNATPLVCCDADSTVFITGGNFTSASVVRIGGVPVPTIPSATWVTPTGTRIPVVASDTLLIAQIPSRLVPWIWQRGGLNWASDIPGAAYVDVLSSTRYSSAPRPLFLRPTITSISPLQAPAGSRITINGSGFQRGLWAPYFEAADGSLLAPSRPMTLTDLTDVTAVVQVPSGFWRSRIRLRAITGDGLLIETISADEFTVGPTPVPVTTTGLALTATGMPPKAPAPPVTGAGGTAGSGTPCTPGCFTAAATGAKAGSFTGGAAVEVFDGSRFRIVLRDKNAEGHYVAFTREEGGVPRPGIQRIANTCGEAGYTADPKRFQVEYYLNDYANEEKVLFNGKSGTITFDAVTEQRVRGRYEVLACLAKADGSFDETRIQGTFDMPR